MYYSVLNEETGGTRGGVHEVGLDLVPDGLALLGAADEHVDGAVRLVRQRPRKRGPVVVLQQHLRIEGRAHAATGDEHQALGRV